MIGSLQEAIRDGKCVYIREAIRNESSSYKGELSLLKLRVRLGGCAFNRNSDGTLAPDLAVILNEIKFNASLRYATAVTSCRSDRTSHSLRTLSRIQ